MNKARRLGVLGGAVVVVLAGAWQGSSAATSTTPKTVVYATPSLALTMDPCFLPGQQTAEILQNLYWEWVNYKTLPGSNGIPIDDTQSGEAGMTSGVLELLGRVRGWDRLHAARAQGRYRQLWERTEGR